LKLIITKLDNGYTLTVQTQEGDGPVLSRRYAIETRDALIAKVTELLTND
jgi:hypothetical protein